MTGRRIFGLIAGLRLRSAAGAITLALLGALALAWGATQTQTAQAKATAHAAASTGVYRTAISSMGLTDNLDPTGEDQVSTGFALLEALQP